MRFEKNKLFLLGVFIILVIGALFFILDKPVSAVGEVSYCCEKTTSGAWCQNVNDASLCATGNGLNNPVPTSCESTSYCSIGTCINRLEGTCNNAPQRTCESNGGIWDSREQADIPQCQVGCCLIGDQAAFVTQANCNRMSSLYNLNISFRKDIKDQDQCLALAFPREKGACVFDDGVYRNCKMLTKSECMGEEERSSSGTTVEFHQGLLCSAESLETQCGPSERTTCVPDKDEVYFLDTCGNIANIYDASKSKDTNYWTYIVDKADSCGVDSSNSKDPRCGNCDYLLGSTCKDYKRGDKQTVQPSMGDSVCADLSCLYQGETYSQGESWCATSSGFDNSLPGSESYRLICYNGEVTTEACPSFREKICKEEEITEDFTVASCVVNQFRDCYIQDNQADCEDTDLRDCKWLVGESILRDNTTDRKKYVLNETGDGLVTEEEGPKINAGFLGVIKNLTGAACVPNYAPGFDFWNSEGAAQDVCSVASDSCLVKYEKGLTTGFGWDCAENCWCVQGDMGNPNENWLTNRRELCTNLGDCGIKQNFVGTDSGLSTGDDIVSRKCETDEEGKFILDENGNCVET